MPRRQGPSSPHQHGPQGFKIHMKSKLRIKDQASALMLRDARSNLQNKLLVPLRGPLHQVTDVVRGDVIVLHVLDAPRPERPLRKAGVTSESNRRPKPQSTKKQKPILYITQI